MSFTPASDYGSDPGVNRWLAQRYNVNNARNFNGTNGMLNNNNVNNANQVQAVTNLPDHSNNAFTKRKMQEETFFSILTATMFAARRNKRYGRDSMDFEADWVPRLVRMTDELQYRTFRVRHNYAFLTSTPRWREIFATIFEGRLADHLLCDTLAPYVDVELHPRTFNNRLGMGSQAAINQVIEDIAEASEGYTRPCRIIKWDLKGFFPNADCDVMHHAFCRLVDRHADGLRRDTDDGEWPSFMKWLAMVLIHCCPAQHCELRTPKRLWAEHIRPDKSLFTKPAGRGVPIGRQPSQVGMGLYLNDEIGWLNDGCGVRSTLFMDDCVMVVPERLHGYALSLLPELRRRLRAKGLELNERKFYDQPYGHGVEFLGTHIKPMRLHLNRRTVMRCFRRVEELNRLPDKWRHVGHALSVLNSYTGLLKNRTEHKTLMRLRQALGPEWAGLIEWNERRQCFTAAPGQGEPERLNRKYRLRLKHIKQHHYDTEREAAAA